MEHAPSHTKIIGQIFDEMTGAFQEEVPSIFPRKDVDPYSIYEEGTRLAGVDVVDLPDGRQIHVFSSVAASPHTLFRVPYQDYDLDVEEKNEDGTVSVIKKHLDGFKSVFKRQAAEAGYISPDREDTIENEFVVIEKDGQEETPDVVPLDMLVWTMIKDTDGTLKPIDINDFASPRTGDQNIDKFRLQMRDDKLQEVYGHVIKRMDLASHTLLELYNINVRSEIPFLPEKHEDDLLQGVAIGFYRGDITKMLGQFKFDGLGKGPMSNSSTHFRTTVHLAMETIDELRQLHHGISMQDVIDFIRFKAVNGTLSRSIHFAENIHIHETKDSKMKRAPNYKSEPELLRELIQSNNIPPIELLKLIDPYASMAHDLMSEWLAEKIQTEFGDYENSIELFAHHAGKNERAIRASEGVELTLFSHDPDVREKALARITRIIGESFSPMWEDIKQYVQEKLLLSPDEQVSKLRDIQDEYGLPDKVIVAIQRLLPTEKQIQNALASTSDESVIQTIQSIQQKYARLKSIREKQYADCKSRIDAGDGTTADLTNMISALQTLQLFNDWNEGYNIPGVPSFGITFHKDSQNNSHILLGWLLSMKGLAELWLGAMVIREKRDSA